MNEMIELPRVGELPPIDPVADQRILMDMGPIAVPLVNRHINPERFKDPATRDEFPTVTTYMGDKADLWIPARYVPWSAGENFAQDYAWNEQESPLYEAARSAILIGLLTEDTLPHFTEALIRRLGVNEALRFFTNVWTAEEGRHSKFLEGYVIVGRVIDPIQLEHDRMANVIAAKVPDPPSSMEALVYVTLQEAATRISHLNTGKLISDTVIEDERIVALSADKTELANVEPVVVDRMEPEERASYLRQVIRAGMTRIVGDENKHHVIYRDLVGGVPQRGNIPQLDGALQIDPSTMVKAIERPVREFDMPGTGIREFWHHAAIIADAGVYDLRIHRDQVLAPVLKKWDLEHIEGLDAEAEQARERIVAHMANLDIIASEFEERRAAKRAEQMEDPEAIWVGKKAA